ncbi:SMI1/KNR4 family protein [Arcobacter sp.]|uniref:SMI1/KNR4 family protein n=1 Tax=Arcobacter sp. TaxID=1872629 RepID=UPI003D0D22BA
MLEKIKALLDEKASKISDSLQSPASETSIQKLEQLIDKKLPDDFIKLYKEHNGLNPDKLVNFAYGIPFIPIEKSISHIELYKTQATNDILKYADSEIKTDYIFNHNRIPIGDDCGTTYLCIDLDPSAEGLIGQIILIDYEYNIAIKLHDSISEYLQQFEADLINNKYSLQEDALDDGNHWLNPIREIDPVNWFNSPTWKHINDKIANKS